MQGAVDVIDICITVAFAADMLFQLNSQSMVGGKYLHSRGAIALNYLRFHFWIDLLAWFPFYRATVSLHMETRFTRLLLLLRLLRAKRLLVVLREAEENIRISHSMVVLAKLLLLLLWLGHFEACGLWYLADVRGFGSDTWAGSMDLVSESNFENYLNSLYVSVTTLTTVGYGDVPPQNLVEKMYLVILMLVNIALSAYILGNITLLTTQADVQMISYRDRVSQVDSYLQKQGITGDLRAMAFRDLKLSRDMSSEKGAALQHVSPFIRNEILSQLYYKRIRDSALFEGTGKLFLEDIIQSSEIQIAHPFALLMAANEHSSHFYFLLQGDLVLFEEDEDQELEVLEPGSTAGEETVLCNITQQFNVRAGDRVVTLLAVPSSDFHNICSKHHFDHRKCCQNFLRHLLDLINNAVFLSVATQKELSERISQVRSHILSLKSDVVAKACHAAAIGNVGELERLMMADQEHDINLGDYHGRRPIHIAASFGQLKVLEYLVETKDADVNALDHVGVTPLHDAVLGGHIEAARYLRAKGAELRLRNAGTTLCNLVQDGKSEMLKLYLDNGADPNSADYDLRTPLHIACADGMLPLIKILLEAGADLNALDRWGESPVDEATKATELTALKFLDTTTVTDKWGRRTVVADAIPSALSTSMSTHHMNRSRTGSITDPSAMLLNEQTFTLPGAPPGDSS